MHEMSIAQSIVEIASDYAVKNKAKWVSEIELEIGTLAGIEFDSLTFALDVCKNNTLLSKADVKINKVQARARCIDCSSEFEVIRLFDACPKCNSYATQLICGKELQVKSLVAED